MLGDKLADKDEIELALDVCEADRAAASRSRQSALVKEMAAKAGDLKKQQAASQEYRRALPVMENDPAEQQAAIGNAWWDAAETRQGAERDTLRLRAGT